MRPGELVQLRWFGRGLDRKLQMRTRGYKIEATLVPDYMERRVFLVPTEWGDWQDVPADFDR